MSFIQHVELGNKVHCCRYSYFHSYQPNISSITARKQIPKRTFAYKQHAIYEHIMISPSPLLTSKKHKSL